MMSIQKLTVSTKASANLQLSNCQPSHLFEIRWRILSTRMAIWALSWLNKERRTLTCSTQVTGSNSFIRCLSASLNIRMISTWTSFRVKRQDSSLSKSQWMKAKSRTTKTSWKASTCRIQRATLISGTSFAKKRSIFSLISFWPKRSSRSFVRKSRKKQRVSSSLDAKRHIRTCSWLVHSLQES